MRKFLLFLSIFSCSLLLQADANKFYTISNFAGGLNSNYSSLTIADNEVKDAVNVWFDDDNSVVKRKGFTTYATTTTVKATNGWQYTDSSNNNWVVVAGSDSIRASKGDGVFTVTIATIPTPSQSLIGATNALGNIYFVDTVNGVYYWNGSSTTYVSGSPKGSFITEYKGRLVVGGEDNPNQNRLSLSKYLDGTIWTTGTLATDPITYIVGLSDKADGITGLFSGLNDAVYIFKHRSIYALYGFDQTDFQVRILTSESGCLDAGTIQAYANGLVYLSRRGFDLFDGVIPHLISKKINNLIQAALFTTFSQRSWTLDSQADFATGSSSPVGYVNTNIISGSVVLDTATAVSSFVDTTQGNFNDGTLDLTLTSATVNSVTLNYTLSTGYTYTDFTNGEDESTYITSSARGPMAQQFTASANNEVTGISFLGSRTGSPGSATVSIYSDSGGSPGSVLKSATLNFNTASLSRDWIDVSFDTALTLTSGQKYWVYIPVLGDTVDYFNWSNCRNNTDTCDTYTGDAYLRVGVISFRNFAFKVQTKHYVPTGTIISRAFDVGFSTNTWMWAWSTFTANSNIPANTNLTYGTQTSSDSSHWEGITSVTSGNSATSTVQRYIRYKATLTSSDSAYTPRLDDVTISMTDRRRSSGAYISPTFNIGTNITSFNSFDVTSDLSSGGTLDYVLCTSSNTGMIPQSCTTQTPNGQILTSTNSWVQFRSTFTIASYTQNPTLQLTTVKWNEGVRRPRMTSQIYKNRYWVSLTTNSVDTNNDCTFVLSRGIDEDKLLWTKFDISAGAYILYKDQLYHADANATGKTYLDDQGYNDAGSAINAYFVTKDYAIDGIVVDKIYSGFWILTDALGGYTITPSYFLDKVSTEYTLSSFTTDEQAGFINLKLPFPIDSTHQVFGKTISFKFKNSDTDAPMRVYGGNVSYKVIPPQ